MSRSARSAFPNEAQSLALKAALLDGDEALAAWSEMLNRANPEDAGIAWIAPLLMANVSRLNPADPWVKAHPHFSAIALLRARSIVAVAERALGALRTRAIETIALKGLALGATVYPSPALRAVTDVDILVPQADTFRAFETLQEAGFRAGEGVPGDARALRSRHAHAFFSEKKHDPSVDVHWHVLESARQDSSDDPFWAKAERARIGETDVGVLCPEHQLLHVLVHGVRWTATVHVRWVADAVFVMRAARDSFRRDLFLDTIERFDAVAPVRAGLKFVFDLLGEGGDILSSMAALRSSRFAERAFKARATAYKERSVADRVALRIESALWNARAARKAKRP